MYNITIIIYHIYIILCHMCIIFYSGAPPRSSDQSRETRGGAGCQAPQLSQPPQGRPARGPARGLAKAVEWRGRAQTAVISLASGIWRRRVFPF